MKEKHYLDPTGLAVGLAVPAVIGAVVALPRIINALADRFQVVRDILEFFTGENTDDVVQELEARAAAGDLEAKAALRELRTDFGEVHYSEIDPLIEGFGSVDKMKERLRNGIGPHHRQALAFVTQGNFVSARRILRESRRPSRFFLR